MQSDPSPFDDLIAEMRRGSAGALARLITIVENRSPGWLDIMKTLYPDSTSALMIGITGPPGSGKSTLTDQLAKHYSAKGKRVGIIAIDPSSPRSGGAFLGDRIRMQAAVESDHVFIRSMSSRGASGGLSKAAIDAARIMAAFGKNYILLETVGIGQAEVDVVRFSDLVLVVCAPNMGDGIQAVKAGIMEVGDFFVVNKADIDGADRTVRDLQSMLAIRDADPYGAQILKTIATEGIGVDELVIAMEDTLCAKRHGKDNRIGRFRDEVINGAQDFLFSRIQDQLHRGIVDEKLSALFKTGKDPYSAIEEVILDLLQSPKLSVLYQNQINTANQEER